MPEFHKLLKVSIHLQEGATCHGMPAYSAILDFLLFRGISGATAVKGIAGFGADRKMHSTATVEISDKLPLQVEFVEAADKVHAMLDRLQEMAGTGMIQLQETTVVEPPAAPVPVKQQHLKIEGKAKMMRIYIGESDRWRDRPLHEALVQAMRANDLAGVTVYKATSGYGAHRRIHKEKPLHLSRDASIMLSVVDTEEKLRAFLSVVDEMVEEGLVTFSDVDVIKYTHRAITEQQSE